MDAPVNEQLSLTHRKVIHDSLTLVLVAMDPVIPGEMDGAGVSGLGDLRAGARSCWAVLSQALPSKGCLSLKQAAPASVKSHLLIAFLHSWKNSSLGRILTEGTYPNPVCLLTSLLNYRARVEQALTLVFRWPRQLESKPWVMG